MYINKLVIAKIGAWVVNKLLSPFLWGFHYFWSIIWLFKLKTIILIRCFSMSFSPFNSSLLWTLIKVHTKYCFQYLCSRHDNGQGIRCYPCPPIRKSVHPYVRTSYKLCPLSKFNNFHPNLHETWSHWLPNHHFWWYQVYKSSSFDQILGHLGLMFVTIMHSLSTSHHTF